MSAQEENYNEHVMTVREAEPRKTLRFEGNKINWFPEGPVIK